MVRMSDLVRGAPATPAQSEKERDAAAARPAAPSSAPPAPPGEAPPAEAPRRRLSLRALAEIEKERPVEAPKGARPASPVRPIDLGAPAELFSGLVRLLERVPGVVRSDDPFPWLELVRLIERVVASLAQSGDLFWVANNPTPPTDVEPLAFHQARVAVLGVRIGAAVGVSPADLIDLGVAGSLIDVGLWLSPSGRVDPGSAEYRDHATASAELVRRWGAPRPGIVEAIAGHHELEHGKGFPRGLSREAIHPHAKVLGLVDRYATATGSGIARSRARAHEVIRDIVRSKRDEFSPALIKALLGEISIFPPGTMVRLNTGEIGLVVGVNRNHPLRPRVEVIEDGKGHALAAPRPVDLSETPFLYITGAAPEAR
jgi:hypothetical protein